MITWKNGNLIAILIKCLTFIMFRHSETLRNVNIPLDGLRNTNNGANSGSGTLNRTKKLQAPNSLIGNFYYGKYRNAMQCHGKLIRYETVLVNARI